MNTLLIDAGNTNIKLAQLAGERWLASDSIPTNQAASLNLGDYPDMQEVWVSNVAGNAIAQQIIEACAPLPVRFIMAKAEQCGVRNCYVQPSQLGSDRWAALIAAWRRVGRACLVVNSGTATTIDALSDRGEFLGGLILPGIELMQRSLIAATTGLQYGGGYASFPRSTVDALLSGAIQASCGAIQRQHALLDVDSAPVLLSGGAACVLLPHLTLQAELTDNLVLQGLLLIARESGKA